MMLHERLRTNFAPIRIYDFGRRECENRQCAHGCFWGIRSSDAGSLSGKEAERGRDRGIGARPVKAEDAADRRSTGRTPDDGSSPVPDWAMPEAHAVHRRDDRRFGQADPGKAAVLFKAGPIGVHSTGNSTGCGREHFSGDWNGYESRRTLSGLSPSGIVGGNMSW